MRIGLVIYHLGRGGAEKIALSMANWWVAAGYRVCILVLSDKREPAYPLADGVTVRYLDVAGRSRGRGEAVAANLRRLLVLRSAIRESRLDVVIGFMGSTNVLTALAAFGTAPVILSEHTDPVACPMGRAWGVLRAIAYPLAAKVTVQTMRSLGRYPARLQRNMTVIPNVIEVPEQYRGRARDGACVVAVGRLSEEKRFDLLLRAFAKAARQHPQWRLRILGEGPERTALEEQRREMGLEGRVDLPGWVNDPCAEMVECGIFALSSRFEGFGNALAEAMGCGLPAVAVDCPVGPAGIIDHGVNGLLVEDDGPDSLAQGLNRLMRDSRLRRDMGRQAPKILDWCGQESVMTRWNNLVHEVAGAGKKL